MRVAAPVVHRAGHVKAAISDPLQILQRRRAYRGGEFGRGIGGVVDLCVDMAVLFGVGIYVQH